MKRVFPLLLLFAAPALHAQPASPTDPAAPPAWTAAHDHRNMMDQLGITSLRPGRNSRADAPNAANYDESKANPYPDLPDPLTLKNGQKVTTADEWW